MENKPAKPTPSTSHTRSLRVHRPHTAAPEGLILGPSGGWRTARTSMTPPHPNPNCFSDTPPAFTPSTTALASEEGDQQDRDRVKTNDSTWLRFLAKDLDLLGALEHCFLKRNDRGSGLHEKQTLQRRRRDRILVAQ
ncbi:hypothetical protein CVT26_009958 [Gymnopilus dilepis]|uniref:Uncharacterized protein n=1 Tax=Gymnopilus dilepis TaxID=231916 RepID=A0A409VL67_9AGAR|nr:hypothetical protein CVT26_009958 [Gymnopilus dilepis]